MCLLRGPDHVFELANAAYQRLLGKHDLVGRPMREAFPEVANPHYFNLLDQTYQTGLAYTGQGSRLLVQRTPGAPPDEHFVDFVFQPVFDTFGKVTGIFVEGAEVTERVRAQAALLAQKTRFETVLETVPTAVWFTEDADAGRIRGNRAAAELLRVAPDANHSLTANASERPEHFRILRDGHPVSSDQLPMQRAARGEDVPMDEYGIAFKDGTSATVLMHARSLRDKAGRSIGAVAAAIDITHRKRAEEARRAAEGAIREREELLRAALAASETGTFRWNPHTGEFLVFDDNLKRLFGFGPEEPVRVTEDFVARVHPEDLAALIPAINACRGGADFAMEYRVILPGGGIRWLFDRARMERDATGNPTYLVGACTDVTKRKQAEEELRQLAETLERRVTEEMAAREQAQTRLALAQRMEALGQLAGGIAHDFNNVLQAVSGGLSLIQKRADNAETVRSLARMATDAAARGAAITARLLAFARRGELRATAVDPEPLLESLKEILATTLGVDISVEAVVGKATPPLLVDKPQLETVLVNLAVNARDAMPDGGGLTLAARAESVIDQHTHPAGLTPGDYVRLDVTDTGIGMDEATLARASEPFFTTKSAGHGTGLGLAMARGFAQQSGGAFAIRSALGCGTTVTLWFPQARGVGGHDLDRVGGGQLPPARRAQVLVVDDDEMVRAVLARQIEAMGYQVSQASDGLDALAQLDAGRRADLLVTDFSMPGMNGLVLIEEARRRQPELPALLLTGFADARVGEIERAQDGRTMLLRKPAAAEELAGAAAALLNDGAGWS